MTTPGKTRMFPLRAVVLGAFVPSFFFEMGLGAVLAVLASTVTRMGADITTAPVVIAMLSVGLMVFDLPAGALAAKVGDRKAMIVAGGVSVGAYTLAALAGNLIVLGGAIILLGGAQATFNLARHSYLTDITPPLRRARVMSTLGGVHRVGLFAGPFIGAGLIGIMGLSGAYWLGSITSLIAVATVFFSDDDQRARVPQPATDAPRATFANVLREYRTLFVTLGFAVMLVGALRSARVTLIPLWGEFLGLDVQVISILVGIGNGIDMLLFYPAGKVMDRLGRNWVAIPSMLLLGLATIAIPFTQGTTSLVAVGITLGFANGIGSGIVMTLGSDVSPANGRAQFLGLWRLQHDFGNVAGPLMISAGTALGSLAAGIWVTSALGPISAVALGRWVPRWSVHANRSTRRAAGIIP